MADYPTHSSPEAAEIPAKTVVLFDKYEVGKLLGCGASGKVYHARNLRSGQSVAIKAVSKQKVLKGGLVAQIKREIAIMRRLRHPNVVKLLEVLATKTKIYFVLEFAKGGELFYKVAKGRFSENLSRRYFQQLITGVGYCHARGVFHRDLKPENLLLDEKLNLKISDFGLSAVRDQIRSDGMLHTFCGTPAYVAPEILAKKGYDGARVDVWSCGVILYVMIAGYLPFNDTNLMNMYRKIYRGEFEFPKWTSPDLRRLLSRLLDKNPATRITVDEIVRDPWFIKGYKHKNFYADDFEFKLREDEQTFYLNAFHLISFSSGFDLSWFLNDSEFSDCGERFLSSETPKKVIETVEAVAGAENIKVRRNKNLGVKLEGLNGDFVMIVEIYRLTQQLVVVEMRGREKNVNSCRGIWENKLRPKLGGLIYQPPPPPPPPPQTEEHGNYTD